MAQSVLRQVHSLFQSVFSTECDVGPSLSVSSIFSLKPSSNCLLLLPRLLVPAIFPSTCPSVLCFRRRFRHQMWLIQLALLRCIVCRMFFFSRLYATLFHFAFHFSRNQSIWYSPFLSIMIFHNFESISDLNSEVSTTNQSNAPNISRW